MNPPFVGLAREYRDLRRRFGSGVATCERGGIDHRPPRTFGDDRSTLRALLQYQRDCVVQARWSPVPSGTSLLWLLRQLGRAEAIWVLDRFAGATVDADLLDDELHAEDTIITLLERYRRIWQLVDATVAASDLDASCVGR